MPATPRKTAANAAAKTTDVKAPQAVEAPATKAKTAKPVAGKKPAPAAKPAVARAPAAAKPAATPAAPKPAAAKPSTAKAAKPAKAVKEPKADKADKADKARKPKLVRDSFTIPKAEYAAIDLLKARAAKAGVPAKKSELLRAGLMALAAMGDAAFLAAVKGVPTLKTGRPAKA